MKFPKAMVTNSITECIWMLVGTFFSVLLIGATAACNDYQVFYCTALVQAFNNMVIYAGIKKKTHAVLVFIMSVSFRCISVIVMGISLVYLYIAGSIPPGGSVGYSIYTGLSSNSGTLVITILLMAPVLESLVELLIHAFVSPSQQ